MVSGHRPANLPDRAGPRCLGRDERETPTPRGRALATCPGPFFPRARVNFEGDPVAVPFDRAKDRGARASAFVALLLVVVSRSTLSTFIPAFRRRNSWVTTMNTASLFPMERRRA